MLQLLLAINLSVLAAATPFSGDLSNGTTVAREGNNQSSSSNSSATSFNTTFQTTAFQESDGDTVQFVLGNAKQHVGNVSEFFQIDISGCYWHLCPEKLGDDSHPYICNSWRTCTIEPIWYNAKGMIANNAHLEVTTPGNNLVQGLDASRLWFLMASGFYSESVKDKKNCYDVWLCSEHEHHGIPTNCGWKNMCNIGSYFELNHYDKDGKILNSFHSIVEFNGKTTEGHFDCVAVKEATVNFYNYHVRPFMPGHPTLTSIKCVSDEVT